MKNKLRYISRKRFELAKLALFVVIYEQTKRYAKLYAYFRSMNVVLFENIGKFLLRPSKLNTTTFLDQNNTVCLTEYASLVDKS